MQTPSQFLRCTARLVPRFAPGDAWLCGTRGSPEKGFGHWSNPPLASRHSLTFFPCAFAEIAFMGPLLSLRVRYVWVSRHRVRTCSGL